MPKRRPDTGKWQAQVKLPPGLDVLYVDGRPYKARDRWVRITTHGTKAQCEAYERVLEGLVTEQLEKMRTGAPMVVPTFGELAEDYIARIKATKTSRTYKNYESVARNHVLPAFAEVQVDKIWGPDLEDYRLAKMAEGLSPTSIDVHMAVISGTLKLAAKRRLIASVPEKSWSTASERPKRKDDFWRADEVERVHAVVGTEPRLVTFVPLALATGLRPGEAAGLRWSDCDFRNGVIRVRQQYTSGEFRGPKSQAGTRDIPMNAEARRILTEAKPGSFLAGDLVLRQDDGRPFQPDYTYAAFNRLIRKAEVRPITRHNMRDTFAAWALREDVDIWTLSQWLGHESVTITEAYYAHLCPDRSKALAARLPDRIRTGATTGKTSTPSTPLKQRSSNDSQNQKS